MPKILTILLSLSLLSVSALAKEELKRIKLLEVISEPEDGLKRLVYLYTDHRDEIQRLDIEIDGKVSLSTSVSEMKKHEVLMANVLGFDSVFLSCEPCRKNQKEINLKYLLNAATGKFRTKKIRIVKHRKSWLAKEISTNVDVKTLKFTSNKILGILVGVQEILVNPK